MASIPIGEIPALSSYQNEIYLEGLADRLPPLTTDLGALEELAARSLPPTAFGYVAGGAGSGDTMRANRSAFARWRIVPRMLRDVGTRDLSSTVLGTRLPAPVLLAPVGVLSIVHPEGELAVARAAASLDVPIVLSTAASHTLEEATRSSS
jgi:isopentenyl diphosphate isomerase/L-lactate dehydrogenase-like FMN-dependent dehydrogenase